ncbi:MAG TPA: anthranilate phosphoribosyltransferase [Aliidongia sp.]|nr:anthranilate phosphoribosyltransferase [Aliidongia sp.]
MTDAVPASFKPWLDAVATGRSLNEAEAEAAFDQIFAGDATASQMGGFLMALRVRGETVDEITGAARSMRAHALKIAAPDGAVDTCGTGGDASGSFNISTAAALVIAACGVPVAKHGNRNLSSRSGSADVLAALGVDIEAPPARIERAIAEIGIGFLMAPQFHSATRLVGPTRVELGTRTIFNLLGPLTNPAGVKRQVVGVYAARWVEPLAAVLRRLGSTACWVVHGDGLDELTTTGPNEVAMLSEGRISTQVLRAGDAGLPAARREDLAGGTPAENAEMLRALFAGKLGPIRDVVLLNAAAALIVAGRETSLAAGIGRAGEAIDSGAAQRILDKLAGFNTVAA